MRTALISMFAAAVAACAHGTSEELVSTRPAPTATAPATTSPAGAPAAAAEPAPPPTAEEDARDAAFRDSGPWGPSVPSAETEARVATLLARMRDGALEPGDLGTAVAFGPGLWSSWQLSGLNSTEGIPLLGRVKVGDKPVYAHGRIVRFAALPPFMKTRMVKATMGFFADAEIGPATAEERRVYFTGIAWQIAGDPVTVARKDGERLVVILAKDQTIFHLELLGPWYRLLSGRESEIATYQPEAPPPSP